MIAHLIIPLNLWPRSRENPIYGSLIRLSPALLASLDNKKPALGGLEKAQALRSLLMPSRDNSPAMMPSSHSGLVGTGGFTGIVADCEV
jgi:hypothetical protein